MLLPEQKNELFGLILKHDLNPDNFQIDYGEVSISLLYQGTDFYFTINLHRKKYYATLCPGENTRDQKTIGLSWLNLLKHFNLWLRYVKRKIEKPVD
jgi:hypothetical protein